MSRRTSVLRAGRVLAAVLVVAGALAVPPSTAMAAESYAIGGTITGAGGAALGGMSVQACAYYVLPVLTCSDAVQSGTDGSYEIAGLAAGGYAIRVSDPNGVTPSGFYSTIAPSGFTTVWQSAAPVTLPPTATGIDLQIEPNSIRGTVRAPDGSPLPGILAQPCSTTSCWDVVTSEADGSYTIAGLAPGSYTLTFIDPAHVYPTGLYHNGALTADYSNATWLTVPPAASGIDVTMAFYTISGTVTDLDGAPISNAGVAAISAEGCPVATTTKADGSYVIENLCPGSYTIGVWPNNGVAQGYYSETGFTTRAENATPVTVPPNASGIDVAVGTYSIAGTVMEANKPASEVTAEACPTLGGVCTRTLTDESGRYVIDGLPPDTYVLDFYDQFHGLPVSYYSSSAAGSGQLTTDANAATPISLGPSVSDVDVRFGVYAIAGTVRAPDGSPLPGIDVQACQGACGDAVTTAADGSFTILTLYPASYKLYVSDPGGVYPSGYYNATAGLTATSDDATEVSVPPPANVTIQVPAAGSISGTVTGPAGQPLPDISVTACTAAGCFGYGTTRQDGSYTLGPLLPGAYTVQFVDTTSTFPSGYYSAAGLVAEVNAATAITVPPSATGIDVCLTRYSIAGTVTGTDGAPLADVLLTAGGVTAQTGPDGHYLIEGLSAGAYRLYVEDQMGLYPSGFYASTSPTGFTTDVYAATPLALPPSATGIDMHLTIYTIAGTVRDIGGNPIAAVQVEVCATNGSICLNTVTDAAGAYSIGGLAPGSYTIWFRDQAVAYAAGYYSSGGLVLARERATLVTLGPDASGIDIALPQSRSISGTVTGPDGAGLQGIVVQACGETGCASGQTWFGGAYTVPRLPPGTYRVSFTDPYQRYASGYYAIGGFTTIVGDATAVAVPPNATGIDVQMGVYSIAGTVTGPDGSPLPGISVHACPYNPQSSIPCSVVTSGADGGYVIRGLVSNPWWVVSFSDPNGVYPSGYWTPQGFSAVSGWAVGLPPSTTGIDVQLPQGHWISGTVTRAGGAPVEGISVQTQAAFGPLSVLTGADGTYALGPLAPGQYTLVITDPQGGYPSGFYGAAGFTTDSTQALAIALPPDATGIDLELPEPHYTLAGYVSAPDGSAIDGLAVRACSATTCSDAASTSYGWFLIGGLAPGSYTLSISDPNGVYPSGYYRASGSAHFTTAVEEATPIATPPSVSYIYIVVGYSIAGRIRGTDGAPLADVLVEAGGVAGQTGADGRYLIDGLAAGSYTLYVVDLLGPYPSGYYSATSPTGFTTDVYAATPVAVPPSASGIDLHLTIYSIGGTVRDAGGTPIASVQVEVCPTAGSVCLDTVTDGAGAYSMGGFAPGSYTVSFRDQAVAYAAGYWSSSGLVLARERATLVTLGPDATGIDVTLPAAASISGTVSGPTGAALSGILVRACGETGCSAAAQSWFGGAYTIPRLLPGSYRVFFSDPGGTYASGYYSIGGLTVVADAATVLALPPNAAGIDVQLPLGSTVYGRVTGPDGSPLSGISVQACSTDGCSDAVSSGTAGSFAIYGLPGDTYRFYFSDPARAFPSGYWNGSGLARNVSDAWSRSVPPNSFDILVRMPGPIARLVVTPTSSTIVAGTTQTYSVQGFDTFDNDWGDVSAMTAFSIAPNGSCHGATCTATTAGAHTVTATSGSATATMSLTVVAGPAATFRLTSGVPVPTIWTAGEAHSVFVRALDAYGNAATDYTGTVHFTTSDPAGVVPGDYTFTSADGGYHAFPGGATLKTAGTQQITVTDAANPTITSTQHGIKVISAGLSSLVVSGLPPLVAGVPGTATVTARDRYGNVVTGYHGTVHFSSSDGQAVPPADYTFTPADAGTRTFAVTLETAGHHSVVAQDTGVAWLKGGQWTDVRAGPAVSLRVVPGAYDWFAGDAHSVAVTARDAYGNTATGYTGTIHFRSSDPTATLPGDYPFVAADGGRHTFTGLAVLTRAGVQTISAADVSSPTIAGTSAAITVEPRGGNSMTMTAIPSPFPGGPTVITVVLRDKYGNVATGYRGTVRFASSDTQATLPADYTFTSGDAGVKAFTVTLRTSGKQWVSAADLALAWVKAKWWTSVGPGA